MKKKNQPVTSESELEKLVYVEYDENLFISMKNRKAQNLMRDDEEFFDAIDKYTQGGKGRVNKVLLTLLVSVKLNFSNVEITNAVDQKTPVTIERTELKPLRTTNPQNSPDGSGWPEDNDPSKNNENKPLSFFDFLLTAVTVLSYVGYTLYTEEVNDFCSRVIENVAEFFGKEKIQREIFQHTNDGMNIVNLSKHSIKEIMLEIPLALYNAQKHQLHEAIFYKFNLTKPMHLFAEEVKQKAFNRINKLVENPILHEQMKKYVTDIIVLLTEAADTEAEKEAQEAALKGIGKNVKDIFRNWQNLAPEPVIKRKMETGKMKKDLDIAELFRDKVEKNHPKWDE